MRADEEDEQHAAEAEKRRDVPSSNWGTSDVSHMHESTLQSLRARKWRRRYSDTVVWNCVLCQAGMSSYLIYLFTDTSKI